MGFLAIFLLAAALAMDCFTVSIVSGVMLARRRWPAIISLAVLFGFFQALMPLIGWICTSFFHSYIEAFDHWIAFAMLAFIGVRMIMGSFSKEEHRHFDPLRMDTRLFLAVATSIDALAVGISFACTGYSTLASLLLPLLMIGLVSFVFSIAGSLLGIRAACSAVRRCRPELIGGIILIVMGIKILFEHLAII